MNLPTPHRYSLGVGHAVSFSKVSRGLPVWLFFQRAVTYICTYTSIVHGGGQGILFVPSQINSISLICNTESLQAAIMNRALQSCIMQVTTWIGEFCPEPFESPYTSLHGVHICKSKPLPFLAISRDNFGLHRDSGRTLKRPDFLAGML